MHVVLIGPLIGLFDGGDNRSHVIQFFTGLLDELIAVSEHKHAALLQILLHDGTEYHSFARAGGGHSQCALNLGKFGVDKYGQQLFIPDAGKSESDLGL